MVGPTLVGWVSGRRSAAGEDKLSTKSKTVTSKFRINGVIMTKIQSSSQLTAELCAAISQLFWFTFTKA